MKLKANINGKDYDVAQGATFSEEFNETLDSGTITIDQVQGQISGLKPYLDVFVYDADVDSFHGYLCSQFKGGAYTYKGMSGSDYFFLSDQWGISYAFANLLESSAESNVMIKIIDAETAVSAFDYYGFSYLSNTTLVLTRKMTTRGDLPTEIEFLYNSSLNAFVKAKEAGKTMSILSADCTFRYDNTEYQGFYKHLLIDQYTERCINISQGVYKYSIDLFSETKRLETIQLPNVSITRPTNGKGAKSVWWYMEKYVLLYSPKIKVTQDGKTWNYTQRYILDDSLKSAFEGIIAPEMTLNNPSLKDVLAQLMITADRIPVVKDDVITSMDITERVGDFEFNESNITAVVGSMSSSNYADSLKRQYSNAISQNNTARSIEYVGFRNNSSALLTLDNMRIETGFPIYKINKIYLCYYKRGHIFNSSGVDTGAGRTFMCKQDITDLVLMDSQRSVLSQDWDAFEAETSEGGMTLKTMAKYQMTTFSYSVGSNYISGFGTKYTYIDSSQDPLGWFKRTETPIDFVSEQLDIRNPYGIYSYGYIYDKGDIGEGNTYSALCTGMSYMVNPYTNDSLRLKAFFFEIDYEGFYNGAAVTKKDAWGDEVTMVDNSSSSLVLLEKDGLFQKEKINRFGNKAIQINARYSDASGLQPLGSVYARGNDDDVIIYHREYSLFSNVVQCTYYGTRDYVLKNYFTSVYSQHRPFNLLPYSQSVVRAENRKVEILLSKTDAYSEGDEFNKCTDLSFGNKDGFLENAISFFKASPKRASAGVDEDNPSVCNIACVGYEYSSGFYVAADRYLSDMNMFVSGYSLCMNARMFDNIAMGVCIDDPEPSFISTDLDDMYKGSTQKWYLAFNEDGSPTTGYDFVFAHLDNKTAYLDGDVSSVSESTIKYAYYTNKIWRQPLISDEDWSNAKNTISVSCLNLYKDNKEVLDMTIQLEPISSDENVCFSSWLMRLSDMNPTYHKVDEPYATQDKGKFTQSVNFYMGANSLETYESGHAPVFALSIPNSVVSSVVVGTPFAETGMRWVKTSEKQSWWEFGATGTDRCQDFLVSPVSVVSIDDDYITIKFRVDCTFIDAFWIFTNNTSSASYLVDVKLKRMKSTETDVRAPLDFDLENNQVYCSAWSRYKAVGETSVMQWQYETSYEPKCRPSTAFGTTWAKSWDVLSSRYWFRDGSIADYTKTIASAISDKTAIGVSVGISSADSIVKTTYSKNMFIVLSNSKISKTMMYKETEAKPTGIKESELVEDRFLFSLEGYSKRIPAIRVNLDGIASTCKSVQYWFYDSSSERYAFVFGVNLTDEDKTNGYALIYLSQLAKMDKDVFTPFMLRNYEMTEYVSASDSTGQFGTLALCSLKDVK